MVSNRACFGKCVMQCRINLQVCLVTRAARGTLAHISCVSLGRFQHFCLGEHQELNISAVPIRFLWNTKVFPCRPATGACLVSTRHWILQQPFLHLHLGAHPTGCFWMNKHLQIAFTGRKKLRVFQLPASLVTFWAIRLIPQLHTLWCSCSGVKVLFLKKAFLAKYSWS